MREKISYKTEYSSWLKRKKEKPSKVRPKGNSLNFIKLSTYHKPTEQTSYNPHFCIIHWLPLNSKFILHWLALWNWTLAVNTALLATGTKLRFVSRGCRRDITGIFSLVSTVLPLFPGHGWQWRVWDTPGTCSPTSFTDKRILACQMQSTALPASLVSLAVNQLWPRATKHSI